MISSRLRGKAQTTIPRAVRDALRLKAGDVLVYELDNQRVILRKAIRRCKADVPFRTFDEWESDADSKAYANI